MIIRSGPRGLLSSAVLGVLVVQAHAAEPALALDSTIPLGDVRGRIDHLAFEPGRQRLLIAELGNDSIGVLDLQRGALLATVTQLDEPQGVAWLAATDEITIANAGDGTLRRYRAANLEPLASLKLGSDADNLRTGSAGRTLLVGHGNGALGILDAKNPDAPQSIALPAHPEGFQWDEGRHRAYVNLPSAQAIAVVDTERRQLVTTWSTGTLRGNFPMALSPDGKTLWAGFRSPPRIVAFDTSTGALSQATETCSDTDDVFFDARRKWIYVICGSGEVDIRDTADRSLPRIARIPTRGGARTGLFVPERDRLYVAAPARPGAQAAVYVFRPVK
ncbi:MAG: hypothetical protein RLZZ200_1969 [Pseudomonadota bacterium]